jgi:GIY-YIG catalytic domain.
MFVYKIENKINNKKYIGITNDVIKRWSNHKCNNSKSPVGYAIQKYGVENFTFDILYEGLTIEEAENKEIQLIEQHKTLTTQLGYNILLGGIGNYPNTHLKGIGLGNNNQKLTKEEVEKIKNNRNQPLYKLYEEFNEKISYSQFKKIYYDKAFLEIRPSVDCYLYNFEYSSQFTNQNCAFSLSEIEELRNEYQKGTQWIDAYQKYKNRCVKEHFWKIYTGRVFKLVDPEVFTEENKKKHLSKSVGSKNPRSKLTEEQVLKIRELATNGVTPKEIHKEYSMVSLTSIRDVINRKTWKHLQ